MQATQRAEPPKAAAYELRWQLTAASAGQRVGAVALGALNLVGVGVLSVMLGDPMNKLALARNGMLWIVGAMPFLQVGRGRSDVVCATSGVDVCEGEGRACCWLEMSPAAGL